MRIGDDTIESESSGLYPPRESGDVIIGSFEDSYPLSPVQQGMLYHGLAAPGSGVDINQLVCDLDEELDVFWFVQAWDRVIERHAILRTSFRWRDLDEPLQDVHRRANMPVDERDLRDLSAPEQEREVAAFLEKDRRRGFDLTEAPLMRLTLLRLAGARYKVIWTFHHIYLDGRSFFVVLTEAFAFYDALREGRDLDLPVPRPFRDYIGWLEQRSMKDDEAFWRAALSGFTTPTPLPIESAASADPGRPINDAVVRARVPADVTARLSSLATKHGVTLNTVVQAAWAILLARYSREDDVVFGATRAGRRGTVEGSDGMVGMFINTLPVRLRIPPGATLVSCLHDLRAQWVAMRDHEHAPLSHVARWSDVRGGQVLFNTIVVVENYNWKDALQRHDSAWSRRPVEIFERTNYAISLLVDLGAEIALLAHYDSSRFAHDAIERMLGHAVVLLCAMSDEAQDFHQRVDALPLLTPGELSRDLVERNATAREVPEDCSIHELIEEQVEWTPSAVAVVSGAESLTYRELDARANQLARFLRSLGVQRGDRVGIALGRGLRLAVGLLGILKAGGAYVPLDPAYPAERLDFMIKDTGLTVVLSDKATAAGLQESPARRILLDAEWPTIERESRQSPRIAAGPEDTAYIIYTSGSTGTPKGVLVTHRSLVNHAVSTGEIFAIGPGDRVAQFSSISFDGAVLEIFPAWVRGGAIAMRPDDALAPKAIRRFIERDGITAMFLTTALWHEWVIALEGSKEPMPESLRLLIVGGEKAARSALEAWQAAFGARVRWINIYGPTETTVFATYYDPSREPPLRPGADVPIGRPTVNVTTYVVDAKMNPVPRGVPGELYIGGMGVAKGYLNRPELTAERFVESPFRPGERLYKTGDIVRILEDGCLEFLGRSDRQVKVRGFRIELPEIESVLSRHPDVRSSAVMTVEHGPGDVRLVGYVAGSPGLTRDALRGYLAERLPPYMLPSTFFVMDALPVTPNGKVDREALPTMAAAAALAGESRPPAAPRTFTERLLVKIWSDVLGAPVGVHDNFFDLGGHSLLMLKIIDRAAHAGLRITPGQLFQHPTVAGLAGVVSTVVAALAADPEWSSLVPLRQSGSRPPLFLVHTTPGDIFGYAGLVSELGPDQPCYGLQSRGLHRIEEGHTDIESMAGYYIEQIRVVRPKGPYHLGGWCYGGVVAVEMAQQLLRMGERVAMVAVIDAMAPRPESLVHPYYADRLRAFFRMGPRGQLDYIREKIERLSSRESHVNDMLEVEVSSGPLANRAPVSHMNLAAIRKYRAKRYPGRLTLFRAAAPLRATVPDRFMGWSTLAADLEVFEIPSAHTTILHEPHIKTLAEHLRSALRRADRAAK